MTPVPISRYVAFGLIATTGVLADLSSKSRVFAVLGYPQRSTEPFFEGAVTFRLYTSLNEGALWGMGQGYAWLFAALSLVAVIGVVYWLFFRGAAVSWWLTVSLALIMSGTLGNLYDRLALHGCVHPVDDQPWHARARVRRGAGGQPDTPPGRRAEAGDGEGWEAAGRSGGAGRADGLRGSDLATSLDVEQCASPVGGTAGDGPRRQSSSRRGSLARVWIQLAGESQDP